MIVLQAAAAVLLVLGSALVLLGIRAADAPRPGLVVHVLRRRPRAVGYRKAA
jgi:hypothetical protein